LTYFRDVVRLTDIYCCSVVLTYVSLCARVVRGYLSSRAGTGNVYCPGLLRQKGERCLRLVCRFGRSNVLLRWVAGGIYLTMRNTPRIVIVDVRHYISCASRVDPAWVETSGARSLTPCTRRALEGHFILIFVTVSLYLAEALFRLALFQLRGVMGGGGTSDLSPRKKGMEVTPYAAANSPGQLRK
jgi:hypothetical protein